MLFTKSLDFFYAHLLFTRLPIPFIKKSTAVLFIINGKFYGLLYNNKKETFSDYIYIYDTE